MVDFKYDFSFLIKMIKFVFLPVLAVVILTAFIIFIYSKKVKKKDIKLYNYLVEFWTTLLAIMVIGSLSAVTIGFSVSLSKSIKMYNLVEGHEIIYYMVLLVPVIPLIFLCVYAYRIIIVLINKPKKEKNIEIPQDEIVPEPSVIEKDELDNNINNEVSTNTDDFTPPLVFSGNVQTNEEKEEDKIDNLNENDTIVEEDNNLEQIKELDETSDTSEEIEVL